MEYPVFHSPPRLQSFSINNFWAEYEIFDFERLRDWLQPSLLTGSLQYIRVGPIIDVASLSKFIHDLGHESAVHTLHFFVEITEEFRELLHPGPPKMTTTKCSYHLVMDIKLDISHLNNLKHLWLDGPDMYNDTDMTQCICQLFAQVNVANLEEATLHLTNNQGLEYIKELDQFLTEERFAGLKKLNVSLAERKIDKLVEGAHETIRSLFVNMDRKGVLKVVDPPAVRIP